MTEDEAKTKWCPMLKDRYEVLSKTNDPVIGTYETLVELSKNTCIASACMMWRWGEMEINGRKVNENGHCGLAGKP